MASITLPAYLKWRDGRPRWEPGPRLRPHFRGRDLKTEAGAWLGLEAAIAAATALNREVAEWRRTGRIRRVDVAPPGRAARTCDALWQRYIQSPEYAAKARKTRSDYAIKAKVWLAAFGDEPVAALRRAHLRDLWERLHRERGHAMANGVVAVAKLVLAYGELLEWVEVNPATRLKIVGLPPRIVVFSDSEVAALIDSGDRIGHPEIADAIVLALHTGQRQGDVLRLERGQIGDGHVAFRISKTGARVRVPLSPPLATRLAAIDARRAGGQIVDLALARRVVLWRGQPYSASWFGRHWRAVRAAAARLIPSLAEKKFIDLRDTAITRLALAECTVPEIRAITGHTLETVHTVLKHYLALDDRMAAAAIGKLRAYMEREEIAV